MARGLQTSPVWSECHMLAYKDGAAKFKSEKYTVGPVQTHLLQYVLHIDVTKVSYHGSSSRWG